MTFQDLLGIWNSLRGQRLESIRRGAALKIDDIDFGNQRVLVSGDHGQKSRPFTELERVWDALRHEGLIHVDSVLAGSGSSRNQPETLLAALPFVEWGVVNNRKHLILRDSETHAAGTLQKASPQSVQKAVKDQRSKHRLELPEIVLPVADIKGTSQSLEKFAKREIEDEAPGEYSYAVGPLQIRIVSENQVDERYRGRVILSGFAPHEKEAIQVGEHLIFTPRRIS
jgi:hypothetical protein